MARKLRLEFPGACYHVINRGNYRSPIFRTAGARAAFESCLFATARKSGWWLHAFVIMNNHFHVAVETPAGNLVSGMHWLQSTFANRFNRRRDARGHVFQGRYTAKLVEEGDSLAAVCRYIHLNPIAANLVGLEDLPGYRHSSLWYLSQAAQRPPCLRLDLMLAECGGLPDTPQGWESYRSALAQEAMHRSPDHAHDGALTQTWAIGSDAFKRGLLRDHAVAALARAWEARGAREIQEQHWEDRLQSALRVLGRAESELAISDQSAPWKVALAAFLRESSPARHSWLARRLHIRRAKYVSRLVCAALKAAQPSAELLRLRGNWAT